MDNTSIIEQLKETHGGHWGEHPEYPVQDWVFQASENGTRLGYWEWVASQLQTNQEEEN